MKKINQQSRHHFVRVSVLQRWRTLLCAGHLPRRLACCNLSWFPIQSSAVGGRCASAQAKVVTFRQVTPSRLAFAAPGCGAILCVDAGGQATATAHAPETAMPTLRLCVERRTNRSNTRGQQQSAVTRNSGTSSSKDSPLVPASVANQSPDGGRHVESGTGFCDVQHVVKHGSPQPSFHKWYISVQTRLFFGMTATRSRQSRVLLVRLVLPQHGRGAVVPLVFTFDPETVDVASQ